VYCDGVWDCTNYDSGGLCQNWDCTNWNVSVTQKLDEYCVGGWNCDVFNGDTCDQWNCQAWTNNAQQKYDTYCQGLWSCDAWNNGICSLWSCTDWDTDNAGDLEDGFDSYCDQWGCDSWNSTFSACEAWNCTSGWTLGSALKADYYCSGGFECTAWEEFAPPPEPPIDFIGIDGCGILFDGGTGQQLDIENATYHLLNDVNDTNFNDIPVCFVVSAKNITLDGLGHYVFATSDFSTNGVLFNDLGANFTIKNINITGFDVSSISSIGNPVRPGAPLTVINSSLDFIDVHHPGQSAGGDVILVNSSVEAIDAHGNFCGNCLPDFSLDQNKITILNSTVTQMILTYGIDAGPGGNITFVSDFIYMDNLVINATGYDDGDVDYPPGTLTINYTNGFSDINASYSEKINLRIVNRSAGEILWYSPNNTRAINSSSLTNLSLHIEIAHNFAYVNGTALLALDKTALISLYGSPGMPFTNPIILRDGVLCVDCYNFTPLDAATVVFNVSGFSNYSIGETAAAGNPVIENISDIGFVNINPGGVEYINFSVLVFDPNGFEDINTVNASFISPSNSIIRYNSSCAFVNNIDSFTANYSCTVDIWYFDEPNLWNVTVAANDSGNLPSDYYFENFLLGQTVIFAQHPLGPDGFTWSSLTPGAQGILANEIMLINNTGNANIPLGGINITATDLIGQPNGAYLIPAENFSVNTVSLCKGTPLGNGENVSIIGALLPRGNNSINNLNETSGQEVLYICIEQVPLGLLGQDYGPAPWDINFNALIAGLLVTIFAVPLSIAGAKKRKKRKLKELAKSLSGEEILEVLGEKLLEVLDIKEDRLEEDKEKSGEIPISIFKEEVSPAEALCKYLKENKNLKLNEIAKLIGRDQRTIWTNCNNASKKMKGKIIVEKRGISIPLDIFKNRKLSILESTVIYLKEQGFKNSEVADMLGKDPKNIWTLYSRAKKKLGIKTKF